MADGTSFGLVVHFGPAVEISAPARPGRRTSLWTDIEHTTAVLILVVLGLGLVPGAYQARVTR